MFNGPKQKFFEENGATETIRAGEEFTVDVVMAADHKGFHYFALCDEADTACPKNKKNWLKAVRTDKVVAGQEMVFDDYFFIDYPAINTRSYTVKIPEDASCTNDQCVLIWHWITGDATGQNWFNAMDLKLAGNGNLR